MCIWTQELSPHEGSTVGLSSKIRRFLAKLYLQTTLSLIGSTNQRLFKTSTILFLAPRPRTLWYLDLALMVPTWGCAFFNSQLRLGFDVSSIQKYYLSTTYSLHHIDCSSRFVVHTKPIQTSYVLGKLDNPSTTSCIHGFRSLHQFWCWKSPLL